VPVRWATANSSAQQAAEPAVPPAAVVAAQTAALSPAPVGAAGSPAQPAEPAAPALEARPAAGAQHPGWGAADDGWRAAKALVEPVSADVTAAGLPRRKPQAFLVPGAAGAGQPAAPARAPSPARREDSGEMPAPEALDLAACEGRAVVRTLPAAQPPEQGSPPGKSARLTCPSCGTLLRLGTAHAGKRIHCPSCQCELAVATARCWSR